MALYADRLTLGDFSAGLSEIGSLRLVRRDGVVFSVGNTDYVVQSDHVRNGRKYMQFFPLLKKKFAHTN